MNEILMTKAERMTKHESATSFGARNLFRFNACWSRAAKSLESLCAVRGVMRTEVRAPVGCGSAAFDVRCFGSGWADLRGSRPASQGVLAGEGAGQCSRGGCAPRKSQRAFSLIEMIGVLAVIAILAAVLAPALIRQMDKLAGDQESAALKSFCDALQGSILRSRSIPSHTNWAPTVATELGVDIATVTNSPRRQPRFFLIDPALRIGNNSSVLPYNQTNWVSGSVVTNLVPVPAPPRSPRVLS